MERTGVNMNSKIANAKMWRGKRREREECMFQWQSAAGGA